DDTGFLGRVIEWWKTFEIPIHLIAPFYDRVNEIDLLATDGRSRRMAFHYAIENMVLGWMHTELRYRFSKPKWLLWDVPQLGSKALETLLCSISAEVCESAAPGELISRLDAALPARPETAALAEMAFARPMLDDVDFSRKMLGDAAFLVERGEDLAAVWPMRMAAFHVARWHAAQLGVPYRDMRSIDALLAELEGPEP